MEQRTDEPAKMTFGSPHWSGSGLTSLVGRADDLNRVQDLLLDPVVRLITLTGPGGVGKTRLAEALSTQLRPNFADGVLFVELAAVQDPDLIAPAILRAIGGEQEPGGDINAVIQRLETSQLLLILDNMEQLLSGVRNIQQLLVHCPNVTALVTSRILLRVRGEFEYVVEPLASNDGDASPAVQLLRDRTRAVIPATRDFSLSAELATQICERVDGLPLAIELAAAQLRILSPDELLTRLGGPSALTGRGPRDLPDRQATMESTVAWSFQLLPDGHRTQLARLAVFAGGFNLEGAQAILGLASDSDAIDTLQVLIANSLVRTNPRSDTIRFAILETIRAFGLQQLSALGLENETREVHAQYFKQLAVEEGPKLRAETDQQMKTWFGIETDIANYRAAAEWFIQTGRPVEAATLVSGLDWFWTDSNYAAEGLRLVAPLSSAPELDAFPSILIRTLRVHIGLADMISQSDQLGELIERALDTANRAGETGQLAELYHLASGILIDEENFGAARAMARKCVESAESHGQTWFVGAGELNTALIEILTGNLPAAISANKRGVAAFQACGDRDLEHSAIITSGLAWLLSGEYTRAQEEYQSVLVRQLQRIEEAFFFQQVTKGIASVAVRTGRPELAARIFGMSDSEFNRTGVTLRKPLLALFETFRDEARTAIGIEQFDDAWKSGYDLTRQEAVNELYVLAAPPVPVSRKMRPAPFNLLSNREFEVLQFLVDGKTDPEIATALFLSPRTVSQHVSNILGKLQVTSRTAAAAMAARQTSK